MIPQVINKTMVEVHKHTIESFAYAMKRGVEERLSILEKHGIILEDAEWFPLEAWLNAFSELANKLGDMNLFLIGSNITRHAKFPPIKSLREALESLNIAYHMNHRINNQILYNEKTGELYEGIGDYLLISYDEEKCEAIMKCTNPYPSKFDEGIITQLVELYKPNRNRLHSVKASNKLPQRTLGGDSCTYIINW